MKKLKEDEAFNTESVKVVLRCRPLNQQEILKNDKKIIKISHINNSCIILKGSNQNLKSKSTEKVFTFDKVFDENETQKDIFQECIENLLNSVFDGYNVTILAYGQTGSGKTYTLIGKLDNNDENGILPQIFNSIFEKISKIKTSSFFVRVNFIEIYNEEINDLLCDKINQKLQIKENFKTMNWEIKDVTYRLITNTKDGTDVLKEGIERRKTASTLFNSCSSRSHAVFGIIIESSQEDELGERTIKVGKINLVDLAGSERQTSEPSDQERFLESKNINLSLSTLSKVINCLLSKNCTYIPYRDSSLTKLLQDSLGGNSRTLVMTNITPSELYYGETLSTLNYVTRIKLIKNTPSINKNIYSTLMNQFEVNIQSMDKTMINKNIFKNPGEMYTNEDRIKILKEGSEELCNTLQDFNKRIDEKNLESGLIIESLVDIQKKMLHGQEMVKSIIKKDISMNNIIGKLKETNVLENSLKKDLEFLIKKNVALEKKNIEQKEIIDSLNLKLGHFWFNGIVSSISSVHDSDSKYLEDEETIDSVYHLKKKLKLMKIIIDNFIPDNEFQTLKSLVKWIPEKDAWEISYSKISAENLKSSVPKLDGFRKNLEAFILDDSILEI